MTLLSDPAYVAAQYQDASRFDARADIYQLYDTGPQTWQCWIFERLRLAPGERVLELGCGVGNLWRENASRIPADLDVVLSDRSSGMLETARARLGALAERFELCRVDAQAIPYTAKSFDAVIASHMLYHVPDRARALGEIERVLRPGGRALLATYAWTHLLELRELTARFGVQGAFLRASRSEADFDLETAADEAEARFDAVRVERRTSALEIRAAAPLVAYVRSAQSAASPPSEANLARFAAHVEREIARSGSLHVGIAAGLVTGVRR
jgi:ubiquinone/menaquinone biosynthesis C-methylase UbiE